jgi:hypothetical protein
MVMDILLLLYLCMLYLTRLFLANEVLNRLYGYEYGVELHFQQNFNYIVVVLIIDGVHGENHRPAASQ